MYNVNSPEFKAARDSAEKAYMDAIQKKKLEDETAKQNELNYKVYKDSIDKAYHDKITQERNKKFYEEMRIEDSLTKIQAGIDRQKAIKDSLAEIRERKQQIQRYKDYEAKQKAIREANAKEKAAKQEAHNKWLIDTYGQDIANKMSNHQVVIGWTKEMCVQSWGKPYEVNKTTTKYGVNEQWVYSLKRYLYFEGDKLTATQE